VTVSATITNSGAHAAEEVAQLYIHDRAASVTRPIRQLIAFRKVRLEPGQSQAVQFTIRRELLEFYGLANKPTVEPGDFDVWIAPSAQAEGVHGTLTLVR